MSISSFSKRAGSLATIFGAIWVLSACGGGVSGEFYNGDGILNIDGDSVTFTDFACSDGDELAELDSEHQFKGELTDDGAQVMWDVENQSATVGRLNQPNQSSKAVQVSRSQSATSSSRRWTKKRRWNNIQPTNAKHRNLATRWGVGSRRSFECALECLP